jgi:streptogramin lyase
MKVRLAFSVMFLLTAFTAAAGAASGFSEMPLQYQPCRIVPGPDGTMWFSTTTSVIGRLSGPSLFSKVDIFTVAGPAIELAAAPDGNLWFLEDARRIGRLTPAGVFAEFPLDFWPLAITADPVNGAVWVGGTGRLAHVANDGTVVEVPFDTPLTSSMSAESLASMPDGSVWFVAGTFVWIRTAAGQVLKVPLDNLTNPRRIVARQDGSAWLVGDRYFARITASGVVEAYPYNGNGSFSEAVAPDGDLWFTTLLGAVHLKGGVALPYPRYGFYIIPGIPTNGPFTPGAARYGCAFGPDGQFWFTEFTIVLPAKPVSSQAGIGELVALDPASAASLPALSTAFIAVLIMTLAWIALRRMS